MFRGVLSGRLSVCAALLAPVALTASRVLEIGTSASLEEALALARAGDEIVVQDGTYRGTFVLSNSGTATAPITIRARHARKAVFDRTLFELAGNHGVLTDFVFERSQVTIRGDHNRIAHSVFRHSDDRPRGMSSAVRTLGGASHNRIHHNEITDWNTYGFRIHQPDARTTGNRIDHNYLHDYSNTRSSNEPEAIQVGSNNTISNLEVATLIEFNLIERVRITGEVLSLKTSGNTVRGNTFLGIHGSIQGRHGRNNTFINNSIIDGKAVLRAFGDGHRIVGNRFVGADLVVPAGDVTQDKLQKPNGSGGHPVARNQLVAANVLEGGGRILVGKVPASTYVFAPENTILAGNEGASLMDGPGFKQIATTVRPAYDGDPGQPVLMVRAQVGPGAPDPLVISSAALPRRTP